MRENCKIVQTNLAPEAIGTYSQGIHLGGAIYFSGQIGLNPSSMKLKETFEAQLAQTLTNIKGLLESEGLTTNHVIKTTIFLTDLSQFPKVNKAYEDFFSKPFPARSCVEVSALPKEAQIEIEVIATKDGSI
jgi:2-iminobutanoate/2-iminopropanoate deaminase